MFTTISTCYIFPKTIEQIRQNMTGHITPFYCGISLARPKVFRALQDQCNDMRVHVFAGASPEKHAQKSF
jgi:hypothetical protein